MHARSAVFDLYGDHLAARGGWAPIASVVRLLAAVDVAAPAVRTAVSRLAREGWLDAHERDGVRGYRATPRADRRLTAAWQRIYRSQPQPWDQRWHLVVVEHIGDRSRRTRVAASLGYLGYARMAADTWVAPRASKELDSALDDQPARCFHACLAGDGAGLAADLWNLEELRRGYAEFLAWSDTVAPSPLPRTGDAAADLERVFALRTQLVHEWRKFLFQDPGLPPEVLPQDWPGWAAAAKFRRLTSELAPAADRFVDHCLWTTPVTRPDGPPAPA